jgi:hypothetical protein
VAAHRGAKEIALDGLRFLVHSVIAVIGVPVAASIIRYSILLSLQQFYPSVAVRAGKQMHWILLQTPYFPVQILIGLLWGFQVGRHYRHRVMLWTWTVPALAIMLALLFAPLTPVIVSGVEITKLQHFFGWGCLPQNHCFEQLALTLPLYSATAYAVGALLSRKFPLSSATKLDNAVPQTAR